MRFCFKHKLIKIHKTGNRPATVGSEAIRNEPSPSTTQPVTPLAPQAQNSRAVCVPSPPIFPEGCKACAPPTKLCLGSSNSLRQEGDGLRNSPNIVEMWCRNSERAQADEITSVADDQSLRRREIWDLATILCVLSIAICNGAGDFVLDTLGEVFNSTVHERCTLTVSNF